MAIAAESNFAIATRANSGSLHAPKNLPSEAYRNDIGLDLLAPYLWADFEPLVMLYLLAVQVIRRQCVTVIRGIAAKSGLSDAAELRTQPSCCSPLDPCLLDGGEVCLNEGMRLPYRAHAQGTGTVVTSILRVLMAYGAYEVRKQRLVVLPLATEIAPIVEVGAWPRT